MPSSHDWAHDDEDLVARLTHGLVADDGVATWMDRTARDAYAWRSIDSDLERLELCGDALVGVAGVRGADGQMAELLEFEGTKVALALEVGERSIIGQVYPDQQGVVTLVTPEGSTVATQTDPVGGFVLDRPHRGPCRIKFESSQTDVVTDWILLT